MLRLYAATLVVAGMLSAVGCVTSAVPPAGYDPATMEPPSIDRSYPPSMEPVAITSHGARLNGIIYVAQNPARIERRSCYTVIPAGVLS